MVSAAKIARRSFLIGSAAVAGGVAFGVWQARRSLDNPLLEDRAEGAVLNPYVVITGDGVTIIAPRAEMGQGIHTTLAALVAEELDVAWQEITVLHGPAAQAYYNGTILSVGLPFRDYAMNGMQHGVADNLGVVGKMLGLQVTSASTSARDGYVKMRHAGASARETLKAAAAARWDIPRHRLSTENGAVIAPDGATLSYADLAEEAALLTPPAVDLRPAVQWKFLGRSMDRKDMRAKATGTAIYAGDVPLPGLMFATVRANPARAGMVGFDPSAALTMDGVAHVIDLGDAVAVVASNTWLAFQAAEAIDVTWKPAAYPATTEAMFGVIEAAFETRPNSTLRDDGDVTASVDGGTEIAMHYSVPFLAHAPMEPMSATVLHTGDSLGIWAGNQIPLIIRDKCAEATSLPPERVTVHTTMMGGSFGRRLEFDYAVQAARVAAALPGTPIRFTWSREEDMRHDVYRPAAMARFRGVVRNGQAVLLDAQIAAPSVLHSAAQRLAGFAPPGADKGHVEGAFDQPYAIPHFRVRGHLADLAMPLGFWRSVGASINGFFLESAMDELAHAAGRDPLDFRRALARTEHAPSAGVLDAVAEMCGWTGQTPEGVGRGVAMTYSFGTPVAEVVEVVMQQNGQIRIADVWIACDVGTALDPRIIESQMVSAAIFGLSAAVMGEITFADGAAEQGNFWEYDALRMHNTPAFTVRILETNRHMGGVGEPATPPAAAALANALYDLTGTRARSLPLNRHFDLLA